MAIFTGAGVALITPMNEDGSVNYEKLRELLEFHVANKTDAIIICGTTGEASTLSDEEHLECIRFACEVINKRIPVIAGTGSNCTQSAIELSKEAEKSGVDGLLLVTPYYNKATQNGLKAHYKAIAKEVNVPIILYNVPSRTGTRLAPQTVVDLCHEVPNIVGVKDATGDISEVAELMSLAKETHDMVASYLEGDVVKSCEMQLKYFDLVKALFCEVNPIPVKKALNLMGMEVGSLRLPLTEMEDANAKRLEEEMRKAGVIK